MTWLDAVTQRDAERNGELSEIDRHHLLVLVARMREALRSVIGQEGVTTGAHAFCACRVCGKARAALALCDAPTPPTTEEP